MHKTTIHYTTPPVASRRLRARPHIYARWKNFDELFLGCLPIHPQSLNSQLVVVRRPCPKLPFLFPPMCKFLLCVLAIFAPPLAVLFQEGCTCNLLINVLLTCLAIIPGTIHAWYLLCCVEERPTHVYIQTHTTTTGHGPAPPAYSAA
ncbi:unnamed protein product [Caenorhabditis auriculariae]|uniref:Uncharacterized protein n=1 Tax=Caenorhabditis auriculariae TaxID=2777116 RepID=A0A8S1GZ79_9PELO|nr:unnamed protein product [Caenorhabditis auriculariae]